MPKPRKSIDDAIASAKKLRQALEHDSEIVEESNTSEVRETPKRSKLTNVFNADVCGDETVPLNVLSNWVRHTTGLRHRTRLRLQDAVDGQKRKARYGQLRNNEPRNEQEIVERGINLVLLELGYLESVERVAAKIRGNAA